MGCLIIINSGYCTSDFEFCDILASEGLKEILHAGTDDGFVSLEIGLFLDTSCRNVYFQHS